MCGIICGQAPDWGTRLNTDKALAALAHRGPDGATSLRVDDVFMGHTRLAIVGVSNGMQPLVNEYASVFACVNGEFYGTEALRIDLQRNGHQFKTDSDSEVLLHLYEELGTDCLKHLHGEFAFALYDKRRKRWFCARDRVGAKPLQYHHEEGRFLIASEAKALIALGVPAKLNRESVWFSQHLQYLPLAETLFAGIHMVKPGHFILVDNGALIQKQYWSVNDTSEVSMTFDEARERTSELLRAAVARRVPREVPWACHLSGGIDSSIVSALSQSAPGSGHCFTVKFTDDGFYDESAFARETAQYIGAQLHEVPVSFGDVIDRLPDAIYHAEGLSINGHLGAKNLLNKAMREAGFKVALTGEGADEIFMGYSHLKQDFLSATSLTSMETTYLAGVQLPSGSTLDLSEVQRRLGFVPTWLAAKSSMAFKLRPLWDENFRFATNPYAQMLEESGVLTGSVSPLKRSSSLWMQYCLSGYILKVLDDAQAMAHGIEGRLPFLDTELMEFAWQIPDGLYFQDGLEKGLLRRGFKGVIPDSVINKTKQSFMSPPMTWALKQPAFKRRISEHLLDSPAFYAQGLFNRTAVESFLGKCTEQEGPSNEPLLMTLLSLALFCERFLST